MGIYTNEESSIHLNGMRIQINEDGVFINGEIYRPSKQNNEQSKKCKCVSPWLIVFISFLEWLIDIFALGSFFYSLLYYDIKNPWLTAMILVIFLFFKDKLATAIIKKIRVDHA